jgi:hypothetical protein
MKLGAFLERARKGQARPAPTKAVKFKILAHDGQGDRVVVEDVTAALVFLDDAERQEALDAADKAAGDKSATLIAEERQYQILSRALRDDEDYAVQFAKDAGELRRAMHSMERQRIYDEYVQFIADEFPDEISAEDFDKLVEEAQGKSLPALLSSFGYSRIRAALPSLAARFGRSQTQTSGATAPAK